MVVPLPEGGDADGFAAPLAKALTRHLGRPVVVDHRPGLAGELGAEIVARSSADGYTFLLGSVEQAIAAASKTRPTYDLQRDLAPVTLIAVAPSVVVVNAVPTTFGTIADLIGSRPAGSANATAPARPAVYASAGQGTHSHLVALGLSRMMSGAADHRPLRGAAAAMENVADGHADFMISPMHLALPAIRAGRLRAIAVTGTSRSFALPSVPTLSEAGVDTAGAQVWYALWSPAGTPAAINRTMQQAVAAVLDEKPMVDAWNAAGAERGGQPGDVLALLVRSEVLNWRLVLPASGAEVHRQGSERQP
jgi:tripartite-type tricarboxylate transporter receptor subunit TctC